MQLTQAIARTAQAIGAHTARAIGSHTAQAIEREETTSEREEEGERAINSKVRGVTRE